VVSDEATTEPGPTNHRLVTLVDGDY
jgi:hypothetical protein